MPFPRVGSQHLESAKNHLALGDTTGAEAKLAEIEHVLHHRPFQFNFGLVFGDPRPWIGRAWSLSGDVAAARKRPEEAARMYRRVVGLWGGGDADLASMVDYARARLDSMSRR